MLVEERGYSNGIIQSNMLNNLSGNKKNIIIFGFIALVLVAALVLAIVNRQKSGTGSAGTQVTGETGPQFMTDAEKAELRVDAGLKAQVLNRDASGTPTVYKLINNDADIVMDPSGIAPLSPRQLKTAK